jgi:hypothetical protein
VKARKTMLSAVACYSEFEVEFVRFLEVAGDVDRFAELTGYASFFIQYVKQRGGLGIYRPNYVVVQRLGSNQINWIVETRGQTEVEEIRDRQLEYWCEDVSRVSGEKWRYLKVSQAVFAGGNHSLSFANFVQFVENAGGLSARRLSRPLGEIWLEIYLDRHEEKDIERFYSVIDEMCRAFDLLVVSESPAIHGSWYKRLILWIRAAWGSKEAQETLAALKAQDRRGGTKGRCGGTKGRCGGTKGRCGGVQISSRCDGRTEGTSRWAVERIYNDRGVHCREKW